MAKPSAMNARDQSTNAGSHPAAPRVSGFVSNGSDNEVSEAIRLANADLELQCNGYMSVPLVIAVEQRDHALRELCHERTTLEAKRAAEVASLHIELRERDRILNQLREQLFDAERELSYLRDEPKTVIGIGRIAMPATPSLASHDSGEHRSLQTALETAWQEVHDARARNARLEDARDAAVRELDEVRREVYAKLESAQDEVIELQTHIDDLRRIFDDARDEWENENFRLQGEVDEVRQALQEQLSFNTELRRAMGQQLEDEAAGPALSKGQGVWDGGHDSVVHTSAPVMGFSNPHVAGHEAEAAYPVPLRNPIGAQPDVARDSWRGADLGSLQPASQGFGIGRVLQRS